MRRLFLTLILLVLPALATAQDLVPCTTSIRGETVQLAYDAENQAIGRNRSYREHVFGGRGQITCPAFVTLRYLTPELDDAERDPFCLVWDDEAGTYSGFAQGRRDAWLGCRSSRPLCERVNQSRDAALAIAGLRDEPEGEGPGGLAGAVRALSDRSGAVILAGTSSYVSSALSSLGAAATATLGAPVAAAAATVTLIAVGGAVYVCSE